MTAIASADRASLRPSTSPLVLAIDRWIYVAMAAMFIAVVLTGFIPDSQTKLAAVEAGQRPPFPLALHVHAVLMGSFLALLLAQATLVAIGKQAFHQTLGLASLVLAPALVVAGLVLVPTMYHQVWDGAQVAPPPVREQMLQGLRNFDNIMMLQIQIGLLFPILIAISLGARKTNPGLHKRLMFLAVALPLPAAFDRITWIPTTMPTSPLSPELYILLAVSPMFLWDLLRTRAIHKAYLIWLALFVPTSAVTHLLWDSDWWHATAPRLVGL